MAIEAFTIRTESELIHQLDHLADSLDKSRNYLVSQALKEYLEYHAGQVERVIQGISAADHGELIAHDDVMHEMEGIIASKAGGRM